MTEFFQFPKGFLWGTATSAYQIEGAVNEDGRSPSIWDVFAHQPNTIVNNENGDVACDHYHRFRDDIQLMQSLGYKAYRFSIAWPRILPQGNGKVNQPGVDFYNRLIDALLEADITPLLTLFHWDIPVAIRDAWLNPSSADAFEEFAGVSARMFGDRVSNWITLNEPFCSAILGYAFGDHAPGLRDPYKAMVAAHHQLLAHGKSVAAIRSVSPTARIGIALNPTMVYPHTDSPEDRMIAQMVDAQVNRWFLNPIYGKPYPEDLIGQYVQMGALKDSHLEFIQPGDAAIIAAPLDFLGINFYTRQIFRYDPESAHPGFKAELIPAPADRRTEMGWEVYPKALGDLLDSIQEQYHPQHILITENGASYSGGPDASGKIDDPKRIEYLDMHIQEVARAIQRGIPVEGYFVWSFMDNFEWRHGYKQRFGLVHVDFETQQRTPRASAYWYGNVIRENGIHLNN